MDFDSIIPLLFVIAFFVLPSIFKQVMAKNKKTGVPEKYKKNPSIFEKIIDQVRRFVRELEEQAQQQRQGVKEQNQGWEALVEHEDTQSDFETLGEDADFSGPSTIISQKESAFEKAVPSEKIIPSRKKEIYIKQRKHDLSQGRRLKSDPLQNAVIWSEILSKPLALKKE
ncbi:MAG: hypothetical protein HOJ48_18945 [Desulfobacula sp.]|jgi:hypothetical protein|nr:hypothetical protein [Desulfobacula sp.]